MKDVPIFPQGLPAVLLEGLPAVSLAGLPAVCRAGLSAVFFTRRFYGGMKDSFR